MQSDLIWLAVIGTGIGIVSGMLGIGGGVLVIPALVLIFKFSQVKAVGTSLGMLLPPIGIFAFISFWRTGHVDIRASAMLACSFAVGAWGGAKIVNAGLVQEKSLRMIFAFFMLYVAGTMLFRVEQRVWAVMQTITLAAGFAGTYVLMRTLGRRWERSLNLSESYRKQLGAPLAPDYEI